ncbi:IclR family transcriptional regulator [Mesorhizobium sp.]|uniref:IclR family transcriptional regulator n=1 Tax=Mesorhizobium sp. TaxID=1871066 RepID=UPI0025D82733|nr:IclR family transcriptional regulator [Mesorhizobium sp.]
MDGNVVKSTGRAFEILELFEEIQEPLTLTDVTDKLGYPASSTLALLKSMSTLGYLAFDRSTKKYVPTIRTALLGDWVMGKLFGEVRILQMMQDLLEKTSETILLGVQSDLYVQYIHTIQSVLPVRYYVKSGTLRPLCKSAMGLALLSIKPTSEVQKIVRRLNAEAETPEARINGVELLALLDQVRDRGYAFSINVVNRGVGAIAMCLPEPISGRQLVVGVAGTADRLSENEARISAAMRSAMGRFLKAS